ncbi:alpha/beta fold hydrolase [Dinoroseobacter sp. S124A]|uniref:alpha/beta fold hydrolase n=1 Tax=Dinoroseobacter sp. S124A TaxID=3415128 RepID=UPI003C7EADA7
MPRASLRGQTIHYQQVGTGPDVVLIHGLFCNIAFWWFRVAPKLAETCRVTALDLRGHGFSAMSDEGYRTVDLAGDVIALMEHLGIQDAHVIGHSFGGAVALAVATLDDAKVRRLTLADAWVPSLQAMPPLSDTSAWPALQKRLRARGIVIEGELPRVAHGFFEELLETDADGANGQPGGFGDAAVLSAMPVSTGAKRRPSRAMRRWRELMARTNAHEEMHDQRGLEEEKIRLVRRPVDLIYGSRSRYLKTRDGLERLMPDTTTVTVPNAGHFFPLLKPDALLHALDTGEIPARPLRRRQTERARF